MKKIAIFLVAACAATAWAQTYVQPHVTHNGTYVQGYMRTAPNNTKMDNYSTQGNVNPYTGQAGTVNPAPQCGMTADGRYVCR